MEHSLNYRAVIRDPAAKPFQDKKTGAWTQPILPQILGGSPASLRVWAKIALARQSPDAYCEIFRVEETLVECVMPEQKEQKVKGA